tara:strand:- start:212 stop:880 length:669 start_codon:yes stop_codon:yes gene_type:complete
MKRIIAMLSILPLSLVAGACDQGGQANHSFMGTNGMTSGASVSDMGYNYAYDDPSDNGMGWDFWGGVFTPGTPINAGDGELSGDYGNHPMPLPMVADVDGYEDGPWTEVNILVDGPNGASMAIFEVWGGLDALPVGASRVYDRWDSGEDGVSVSVIGCAGREPFVWDYDDAAEEVEVTVTEDPNEPGARVYEFTARFGDLGYGAYGNALSSTGELRGRFVAR